jgi:formate-dependent nitrite reductase cytochrome c552 subunit
VRPSAVTADQVSGFDDAFQLAATGNNVGCTTCHEMKPHCERDVKQKYRNSSFLRGGPFESRADQCFSCHKKSDYKQRSPHRQVRRDKVIEGTCTFCHGAVPQQDESGAWMPVQFVNQGAQSKLCSGCHEVGPHPSSSISGKTGWIHFAVPPERIATAMQDTLNEQGGRMPLDPISGETTCATCHDPHDRKLQGLAVAKTPGTKAKLRYDNICGACHAN